MKLEILGAGTLVPDDRRRSAAHLVTLEDLVLLLDCGPGSVHGMARFDAPWDRITHVALTHFHADHVGDLPHLLFALRNGLVPPRETTLEILGPRGTRRLLEDLATAFGSWVTDPGFPLRVTDLGPLAVRELGRGASLRVHPTVHVGPSVAYRVATRDGIVAYTGDTGPSADLGPFLAGCDVLICECSHADPPRVDIHLTPGGVAALARAAAPGLVITTHAYPPLDPEQVPELVRAAGYGGEVVAGVDGLTVTLRDGRWSLARDPDP